VRPISADEHLSRAPGRQLTAKHPDAHDWIGEPLCNPATGVSQRPPDTHIYGSDDMQQDFADSAQAVPARQRTGHSRPLFAMSPAIGRTVGGYVPEVDALRALAMSAVIAFHCGLMPFGWMGVWLFFVISGFAVTTSLLAGEERGSSLGRTVKQFYLRRVLRIWPVYMAFIVCNVLVLLALGKTGPLSDLPWLLSFTQNLRMIFKAYTPDNAWGGFEHLWTLAVEQQFYLVFPLLLLLRGKRARGLGLLGIILVAPLIRALVVAAAAAHGWDNIQTAFAAYAFAPAHFDAFAAGSLIALFRTEIATDRRILPAVLLLATICTVGHIGAYLTIGILKSGNHPVEAMRNIVSGIAYGQGREISFYLVPTSLSAAALVGILSGNQHCLRALGIQRLQAIGQVSYGGYLFHVPVLMIGSLLVSLVVVPLFHSPLMVSRIVLFAAGYPVTIALAWLSYTYFEKPLIQLRRRA
jgi:peptidoglycan/LPS O-acetylase OafA/YrhL